MKARAWLFLAAIWGWAGLAAASPVDLFVVDFPEDRWTDISFRRSPGAPAARVSGSVEYRAGQAEVRLKYDDMKPAILYGGDITCYVVWAVTRDGRPENLGELLVSEPDDEVMFTTPRKNFALLITAEPYYLVSKPSPLPVFTNEAAKKKTAPSILTTFSDFGPTPKRAMDSIEAIAWDSDMPLDLLQARKAYELATALEAKKYAPQIYEEAGQALNQANDLAARSPGSRKMRDHARRAVALSNSAINISNSRIRAVEIERQMLKRQEEMTALEARAAAAEQNAEAAQAQTDRLSAEKQRLESETAALAAERSQLETEMKALRMEKASLEKDKRGLQEEKTELSGRLKDALSHVAATEQSARGVVVSLPDILFDLNKATLKPGTQMILAKLAGILLIMPELQVTIEGHTDTTGTLEYNMALSRKRAEAVRDFLITQELSVDRMSAVGLGWSRPIADNDTSEGRAKNRRVEILLNETS